MKIRTQNYPIQYYPMSLFLLPNISNPHAPTLERTIPLWLDHDKSHPKRWFMTLLLFCDARD